LSSPAPTSSRTRSSSSKPGPARCAPPPTAPAGLLFRRSRRSRPPCTADEPPSPACGLLLRGPERSSGHQPARREHAQVVLLAPGEKLRGSNPYTSRASPLAARKAPRRTALNPRTLEVPRVVCGATPSNRSTRASAEPCGPAAISRPSRPRRPHHPNQQQLGRRAIYTATPTVPPHQNKPCLLFGDVLTVRG
jgi:hypothetical protein